jgi:hypothetical protein
MLTLNGCYKQRYEWAQGSTSTTISQARDYEAAIFPESKSAFESAETAFKAAESQFQGQQFSDAFKQIGEAKRQANEALNQARSRFAAKMLEMLPQSSTAKTRFRRCTVR